MKLIIIIYKFFLARRYKVKIKNSEFLKHNWPVLLLPNHMALVDPQILMTFLDKYLSLSPVASEKFFNVPILKQIMTAIWTIPIWEMEAWADAENVKKVFNEVTKALENWKNILIYPSWEIYKQGFESIIWKQAVYNIAKNMPENTKVVGLRQRWLWGSVWSKAYNWGKTGFFTLFWKWVFYVFVNLIFFIPKRKVNIELEDITKQINLYKNMSLAEFNSFLEDFFNKNPLKIIPSQPSLKPKGRSNKFEEKATFVKHFWFYNDVKNKKEPEIIEGSLKDLENTKNHDLSQIDEEIKNKIIEKIAKIKEIDKKNILENSKLIVDLFFDSLDLAEIKSFVQANFSWSSNTPITDLKTVWDLIIMAVGQSSNVEEMKVCDWKDFWESWELSEKLV